MPTLFSKVLERGVWGENFFQEVFSPQLPPLSLTSPERNPP
jgi:hypothetical protein